jgi:hypothetical protein
MFKLSNNINGVCMTKKIIITSLVAAVITTVFLSQPAAALSIFEGVQSARGANVPVELFGSGSIFTTIVNILLFIVGALSVIMLIIGGLRYVISGGNSSAVTAAKNTILYAIVGLIVSLLAFAAINFVIDALGGGLGGTSGFSDR